MEYLVIANNRSGALARNGTSPEETLRKAFRNAGGQIRVEPFAPERLDAMLADAKRRRVRAIVAAGGDGTISAIAARLARDGPNPIPLAILPAGTFNHFARDLGVPNALDEAVTALDQARPKRIDLAEVNGRPFLNNASIGIYPSIVQRRKQLRRRFGWSKWFAMSLAILSASRRFPMLAVDVRVDGSDRTRRTPFVFVGNNRYELSLLQVGERERLDRGLLSVYFSGRTGRWGAFRLLVRAGFGRLEQARDFVALERRHVTIQSHHRRLRVALDGELVDLATPLRFSIRPQALTVLAPPGAAS